MSADGRHVLFLSRADDLVEGDTNNDEDAFVFHVDTETVVRVSVDTQGRQGSAIDVCELSGDGRYVLFQSPATNLIEGEEFDATLHLFRKDRLTGELIHISRSTGGEHANDRSNLGGITADG